MEHPYNGKETIKLEIKMNEKNKKIKRKVDLFLFLLIKKY